MRIHFNTALSINSVPHNTLLSEWEKLCRIHIKKKQGFAVGTYKELQVRIFQFKTLKRLQKCSDVLLNSVLLPNQNVIFIGFFLIIFVCL